MVVEWRAIDYSKGGWAQRASPDDPKRLPGLQEKDLLSAWVFQPSVYIIITHFAVQPQGFISNIRYLKRCGQWVDHSSALVMGTISDWKSNSKAGSPHRAFSDTDGGS